MAILYLDLVVSVFLLIILNQNQAEFELKSCLLETDVRRSSPITRSAPTWILFSLEAVALLALKF
jgi:hypothetical protein